MQKPLAGLNRGNIVRELTAGVTLLAIAIPLNIGYAQIAGLPPTAGLYALVLPAVVYALTVSSRQLVASPDAAAAALVASSIGGLAVAGSADYLTLALAQAILCGVMFLALRVLQARLPRELPVEADPRRLRRRPGPRHPGQPGRQDARREDRLRRRVRRQGRRARRRARHHERMVAAHLGRRARRAHPGQAIRAGGAVGAGRADRRDHRRRHRRPRQGRASRCSARWRPARRRSPGRSSTGARGSCSSRRPSRSPW